MLNLPPFFKKSMPYTLHRLESPRHRHVWLPLNRFYKPLGQPDNKFVNYADFAHQALVFERDPRGFKEVWVGEMGWDGKRWLYDQTVYDKGGMRDYFARLERLMSHSHAFLDAGLAVEPVEPRFAIGDPVVHERFGAGTVVSVDGVKVDVAFYGAGRRRVIDSFLSG